MYVTKKDNFPKKIYIKSFTSHSTNRNLVSLIEGAISINALILWNEHISHAVNFEQANTHYDMIKIVRHFEYRKEHCI